MSLPNKQQLLERVIAAIKACGWQYLLLGKVHPFRLRVFRDRESYNVCIYIWNLTHGGGKARPVDEYRIQITGVDHFEPEPGGKTLILGWWEPVGVFAGFDFRKHIGKLGASPSMQIRESFLQEAYQSLGLSPCNKGNQEIAIAFHPQFIIEYIRSLEALHDVGKVREDFEILKAASIQPSSISESEIENVTGPRRKAIQSVIRTLRDTSFRERVLTAYGHRCAMCGLQLELVEAAHIVPVSEPASTDETCNGVALCALHHRAYDRAFVAIANDYHVWVSSAEKTRLKTASLDGGISAFTAGIRPIILLPPDMKDMPKAEYLERAREIRNWLD